MYTRCLFCHQHLGSNTEIAPLPVGRRLAFDSLRGRLWVICPHCARWNLTAVEERWEAIEECERRFRATPLRFSTDNIGLARLSDGTELVRIGRALRPEIAAWRYGAALRRWRLPDAARRIESAIDERLLRSREALNSLLWSIPRLGLRYDALTWLRIHGQGDRVLAIVQAQQGPPALVRFADLERAELLRPERAEPWRLRLRHARGESLISGDEALRTAAKLLAALNGRRATGQQVQDALRKLEDAGKSEGYFAWVAALALRTSWGRAPDAPRDLPLEPGTASLSERLALRLTNRSFWARGGTGSEAFTLLPHLPLVDRLALEMAANEDAERRVLEGELRQLEAAWREAEEIAAIADGLLDDDQLPGRPDSLPLQRQTASA
ncbi:MAG TPA: hypothetical protein VGR27_13085 [Longimicrobiaceae bacterium]|nr:hypothetical protein [Longimicrobiaceae bacterium]